MFFVLTGSGPEVLHQKPRRQMTFEMLARACRATGVDMMLTTPARIHVKQVHCRGWVLDMDTGSAPIWRKMQADLRGGIVYDAMYLADLKTSHPSYRQLFTTLARLGVPMFNQPLPAKDELYEWLLSGEKAGEVSILPTTFLRISVDEMVRIMRHMPDGGAYWFKPVYGSGGRNMLRVERIAKRKYRVHGERFYGRNLKENWTERELRRQLQTAMERKPYLLQRDVALIRTLDGRKVDFRVTVARGSHGVWAVTGLTARFARLGAQMTNYHAGGTIESLLLGPHTKRTSDNVDLSDASLGRIINAALAVARRISEGYPHVGLLGIDVGLSTDGRVYVYDCNRRPGRDILTDLEIELTMQQIARFGAYLLNTTRSL